jgi:hypothetical protein
MGTPPVPHRRRTSSGSSGGGSVCGGNSPPNSNWTVSPSQQQQHWCGGVSPRSSPLRHSRSSGGRFTPPSLPPILGSPNTWAGSNHQPMAAAVDNNNVLLCRANSTDLSMRPTSAAAARNTVVLNYSPSNTGGALFAHGGGSILTSRRSSNSLDAAAAAGVNNKENQCPLLPPPDLSEETLLAPEHNEVLSKLRFIAMLVDTIIGKYSLKPVLPDLFFTGSGTDGIF